MAVVSPDAFARLVGSLDADAFAAFVADVWAARGWETTVEGGTVRAVGGPGDGEETIACIPRRRWRRDRRPPDGAFDVVVSAAEASTVGAGFPDDTRVLGPRELHGLFLYGIDREAADAIFDRHFGRSIWIEEPEGSGPPLELPPRPAAVAVGLVVLVIAAALAMGGGTPVGLNATDDPGLTVTAVPSRSTAAADEATDRRYPAGIDPSGLTDLEALVAGHRRAVLDRSFELLIVHERSVDLFAPDRDWIASRQTANRHNATHFHYRVTGLESTPDGNLSLVVYDDYADGAFTYRRIAASGPPTYRRGVVPTAGGDGAFIAVGTAYLRRYLATSQHRVELITPAYPALYRLVATGRPRAIPGPVVDYRAAAVIDEEGVVHRLTVEYVRPEPNASDEPGSEAAGSGTEVRFELVYSEIGETTVGPPPWYDDARTATNGTLDELRSPESLWWSQPIGIDYRDD